MSEQVLDIDLVMRVAEADGIDPADMDWIITDLCRAVRRLQGVLDRWHELVREYFQTLDLRSEAAMIDDVDQLRCCNHEMGYLREEIEKLPEAQR